MGEKNWRTDENLRFINPYTFAALGSDVQRSEHTFGGLTGRIACTLTVKSPLAIPNSAEARPDPQQTRHKSYPFFRLGTVPTIPGSQLRGAIRSVYETLSNSCFSVNNNNTLSSRHTAPRKPGILQKVNGEWQLFEADVRWKRNNETIQPDTEVKRQWQNPLYARKLKNKQKPVPENMVFIYVFSKAARVKCDRLADAVDDYRENLKLYEVNANDVQKQLIRDISIRKEDKPGKLYPLFYEFVNDEHGKRNVYLCPSQIGRSVYAKKLDDLLGSHCACSKRSDELLCRACALFGTLSKSKKISAYAGQVRFTDAKAVDGTWNMTPHITLKELSTPKTTAVEFYTERPKDPDTGKDALYWTYESITTGYKKIRQPDKPYSDTIPIRKLADVKIRGRKFYYHAPKLMESDYRAKPNYGKEKTERNISMELCKPGAQFQFEVYFERITQEQLHELVWTLTLGDNQTDSPMQHKLGHGKPLGLGDVKITVDDVETRRFEQMQYHIEKRDPKEFAAMPSGFDPKEPCVQDLLKIVNVHTLDAEYKNGIRLSYPKADGGQGGANGTAAHQWFKANREMGEGGSPFKWVVKDTLPSVGDANHDLPGYVSIKNRGGLKSKTGEYKSSGEQFTNKIRIKTKEEKHDRKKK